MGKSFQSCSTVCNPMDCSPAGSSVHGILQARIVKCTAMPSSRGIFPTQGSNPRLLCLLRWQAGSLPLAPHGKPMDYLYTIGKQPNIHTFEHKIGGSEFDLGKSSEQWAWLIIRNGFFRDLGILSWRRVGRRGWSNRDSKVVLQSWFLLSKLIFSSARNNIVS